MENVKGQGRNAPKKSEALIIVAVVVGVLLLFACPFIFMFTWRDIQNEKERSQQKYEEGLKALREAVDDEIRKNGLKYKDNPPR